MSSTVVLLLVLSLFGPFCSSLLNIKEPSVITNFPDPSIIRVGNTYYSFATANGNPTNVNVQVAKSTDYYQWTVLWNYDAMPVLPRWALRPKAAVWAPDVRQLADGTFVMYFAAFSTQRDSILHRLHHCVGAAVSRNVSGPYIAVDEPLACDLDIGGAIDPDGFHDPVTGHDFVVYKVDGNSMGKKSTCISMVAPTPLRLQRVDRDGYTPIGQPVDLLMNTKYDGPNTESPTLLYRNGLHYLLYNSGCYAGKDYTIRYAISAHGIYGPYRKQPRPLVITGQMFGDIKMVSPGGPDIDATNTSRIIFHADTNLTTFTGFRFTLPRRVRAMFAAELIFEGSGVLSVRALDSD